jgi:molybdopterin/thiamine biosynthesis adenylyltransferase/rhodanese-related sulfurtransferase
VRPHAATSAGIAGSTIVGLEQLVTNPSASISTDARVLIVCDIGMRSAIAVKHLRVSGYTNTVSLAGGIDAWRAGGLPLVDTAGLTDAQLNRYDRHLKLTSVGVPGQRSLLDATVAVVGAGGLGSPVVTYLAAAGVGTIRIIDDDVVDTSNLQRQPLHSTRDVGEPKVESAQAFVHALNPDVTVEAITDRLDVANAIDLLGGTDVVVDASDNFAARYAINDASVVLGIPVVFASVYRMEGQVAVFDAKSGPCYRCIFPEMPDDTIPLDCQTVGVLGSVTGVLGSIQATETIKLIVDSDETLIGRLLLYDGSRQTFTTLKISKDPSCPTCAVT